MRADLERESGIFESASQLGRVSCVELNDNLVFIHNWRNC